MVVLAAMFVYGDHIPASPELTYTKLTNTDSPKEKAFCSDEIKKYKKELDQAEEKIQALNSLLKKSRAEESLVSSLL